VQAFRPCQAARYRAARRASAEESAEHHLHVTRRDVAEEHQPRQTVDLRPECRADRAVAVVHHAGRDGGAQQRCVAADQLGEGGCPVPALVLTSPLHRLLSGRYALLEFTGRRTGARYRTPVTYVGDGQLVLLSTDPPWWRNLEDRPQVRLRLRGREVEGRARVVTEDHEAAQVLGALVRAVPGYRRPAGLAVVWSTTVGAGPLLLRVLAVGTWGFGLLTTVLVNLGINVRTAAWDPAQDPERWQAMRRRWEAFQGIRSWAFLFPWSRSESVSRATPSSSTRPPSSSMSDQNSASGRARRDMNMIMSAGPNGAQPPSAGRVLLHQCDRGDPVHGERAVLAAALVVPL
jgi:deazaflavin-dependent oxidoreductase (nitroreductase family)